MLTLRRTAKENFRALRAPRKHFLFGEPEAISLLTSVADPQGLFFVHLVAHAVVRGRLVASPLQHGFLYMYFVSSVLHSTCQGSPFPILLLPLLGTQLALFTWWSGIGLER